MKIELYIYSRRSHFDSTILVVLGDTIIQDKPIDYTHLGGYVLNNTLFKFGPESWFERIVAALGAIK